MTLCPQEYAWFAHPGSESKQFQQHLKSEESRKHHVEYVHDMAEGLGLLVVLWHKKQNKTNKKTNRNIVAAKKVGDMAYVQGTSRHCDN